MDQIETSGGEKYQIKSAQEDKSRLRSLEFLLLAVGRQILSSHTAINGFGSSQKYKEDLKTLSVHEDGHNWVISTQSSRLEASKSLFSFYRRESSNELFGENFNAKNAEGVLRELLNIPYESNSVLEDKYKLSRSQAEMFNLFHSMLCIVFCTLLNLKILNTSESALVLVWALYASILLVASFSKKRIVQMLVTVDLMISVLLIVGFQVSNQSATNKLTDYNSLLITTILFASASILAAFMGKGAVRMSGSFPVNTFMKILIASLAFYLIASNLEAILREMVQIIFLVSFIVAIYQVTRVSRKFIRLLLLIVFMILGLYCAINLLPDLRVLNANYVLLLFLVFIAVNIFEFFHGRRLDLIRFVSVNTILMAGVIG